MEQFLIVKLFNRFKYQRKWFFVSLLFLTSCSYLLSPNVNTQFTRLKQGEYQLDKTHTSVLFKVSHMQLSTFVGRFNLMHASLNFDPNNPLAMQLSAMVETASVDVNNTYLEESLVEPGWFNSQVFPRASLRTLSVEKLPQANQFKLMTELTLLGESRPLVLTASFHGGANNILTGYYTLGFSAVGELKRSQFGLDQYIPMVGDKVSLEIYAEFQKR